LTQGVTLSDTRRLTGNYKRSLIQTAGVASLLGRIEEFYRKCVMTAHNTMSLKWFPTFYRKITEQINASIFLNQLRSLFRKCTDNVKANSETKRKFNVIRKAQDVLNISDTNSFTVLYVRSVPDCVSITHTFKQWKVFIRELRINAGSIAETSHKAEYYRFTADTVQAAGTVFRGLLLFVKIVTKVFIRDYLLRRFLIAREELKLKSVICREIVLESRID